MPDYETFSVYATIIIYNHYCYSFATAHINILTGVNNRHIIIVFENVLGHALLLHIAVYGVFLTGSR